MHYYLATLFHTDRSNVSSELNQCSDLFEYARDSLTWNVPGARLPSEVNPPWKIRIMEYDQWRALVCEPSPHVTSRDVNKCQPCDIACSFPRGGRSPKHRLTLQLEKEPSSDTITGMYLRSRECGPCSAHTLEHNEKSRASIPKVSHPSERPRSLLASTFVQRNSAPPAQACHLTGSYLKLE